MNPTRRLPSARRAYPLASLFAPAAAAIALATTPVQAQQAIHHPGDGHATIQAAVDAAGCGGTVLLAAGTYNERVFAPCGVRLIGAGMGATILDGTDLVEPVISQVVGFGAAPFAQADFTVGYELAGVTIRAGSHAPLIGVGLAWTQNAALRSEEHTSELQSLRH